MILSNPSFRHTRGKLPVHSCFMFMRGTLPLLMSGAVGGQAYLNIQQLRVDEFQGWMPGLKLNSQILPHSTSNAPVHSSLHHPHRSQGNTYAPNTPISAAVG